MPTAPAAEKIAWAGVLSAGEGSLELTGPHAQKPKGGNFTPTDGLVHPPARRLAATRQPNSVSTETMMFRTGAPGRGAPANVSRWERSM